VSAPAVSTPPLVPESAVWRVLGVLCDLAADLDGLHVVFYDGGGVHLSLHRVPAPNARLLLGRLGVDPICGRPGPLQTGDVRWLTFAHGNRFAGGVEITWFCHDPSAALAELLEIEEAAR
jgi:hypothetical protein